MKIIKNQIKQSFQHLDQYQINYQNTYDELLITDLDYDYVLHFTKCIFNNDVRIKLKKPNLNTTIYFFDCLFKNNLIIEIDPYIKPAITISFSKFEKGINDNLKSNYPNLMIYNLEQITNKTIQFKDKSGYKTEYSDYNFMKQIELVDIEQSIKLNVKNIPQYLGTADDPALYVGCEATAVAASLSYILNKDIKKKETASLMPQDLDIKESFWDYFIGDIVKDGWGCMSPVSVKTIKNYFKKYNIKDFEVYNLTGLPFYLLFQFLKAKYPLPIWATMGNDKEMYKVKYGSTIFKTIFGELYWPGNDHSLSLVGYDLEKNEVYLADPEVNGIELRTRKLIEFENRYTELYAQAILIRKSSK